ncbi:MAG TPA: sigma-70 family RNA polymerase sigma factor [Fibrobacteria bacterium]|nr:sigma-70 family RNA polymerase sigma factor [Fibrobacteria bacterium]
MPVTRTELAVHFGREWKRLAQWVRRRLADSADREGEDIVHEVYATLFESDGDLPIDNLSAYVYTALRHRVIDRMRRRKPLVSLESPVADTDGLVLADILPSPGELPPDSIHRQELSNALHHALGTLDDASREIVVATEFEGRTFRELSELWQVPIGTLLSRKSRALRRLAVVLAEYND